MAGKRGVRPHASNVWTGGAPMIGVMVMSSPSSDRRRCESANRRIGGSNPRYSKTLADGTARPDDPLIFFHLWNGTEPGITTSWPRAGLAVDRGRRECVDGQLQLLAVQCRILVRKFFEGPRAAGFVVDDDERPVDRSIDGVGFAAQAQCPFA